MGKLFGAVYHPSVLGLAERTTVAMAVTGFLVHLGIIALDQQAGAVSLDWFSSSYFAALYTPFSFLLFYEVLLLVRALPRSFSASIGKQYEVITLIVLRRVFKDIALIDAAAAVEISRPEVLYVLADMGGSLLLYFLLTWFRRLSEGRPAVDGSGRAVEAFVAFKQLLAVVLGLLVVLLAVYSLQGWVVEMASLASHEATHLSDVNAIFYEDFFGLLVLVDVLVLIVSFGLTHDSHLLFRNAGFVASTVLVRLSFMAPRLDSLALLLLAVGFGVAVQLVDRVRERWIGQRTQ